MTGILYSTQKTENGTGVGLVKILIVYLWLGSFSDEFQVKVFILLLTRTYQSVD